jgi:hypothetical protein
MRFNIGLFRWSAGLPQDRTSQRPLAHLLRLCVMLPDCGADTSVPGRTR